MGDLSVERLLQNPLGQAAPPGHRGDIVRVTDGVAKVYLHPREYESLTHGQLHMMLAEARLPRDAGTVHPGPATTRAAAFDGDREQ